MTKIFSICLHRVSDEYSPAYPPMPVDVFKRLILYLKKRYGFLSLEDLNDVEKRKKGGILLTFDDAYYDFYINAFPFLKEHNIPTILNVITSCAETGSSFWTQKLNKLIEAFYEKGRSSELRNMSFCDENMVIGDDIEITALNIFKILLDNPNKETAITEMINQLGGEPEYTRMMNWAEIQEVYQNGIVIGSHTHSHRNLTLLSEEQLINELNSASVMIEKQLGFKPDIIAFPNGVYNRDVLETTSKLNYKYALTVEITSYSQKKNREKINIIPRINVYNQSFFKNWIKLTYYFIFK